MCIGMIAKDTEFIFHSYAGTAAVPPARINDIIAIIPMGLHKDSPEYGPNGNRFAAVPLLFFVLAYL